MKFIWPKIFVSFVVIVAFLTFRSFSTDSFTAVWRYAEVEETIISADVASITSHRCSFGRAADTMMFTMYIAMSLESFFYLFSIRGVSSKFQDVGYVSAFWLTAAIFIMFILVVNLTSSMKLVQKDMTMRIGLNVELIILSCLIVAPKIYRIFAEKSNVANRQNGRNSVEVLRMKNLDLGNENKLKSLKIRQLNETIRGLRERSESSRVNGLEHLERHRQRLLGGPSKIRWRINLSKTLRKIPP